MATGGKEQLFLSAVGIGHCMHACTCECFEQPVVGPTLKDIAGGLRSLPIQTLS
jgi:hypothetical protein